MPSVASRLFTAAMAVLWLSALPVADMAAQTTTPETSGSEEETAPIDLTSEEVDELTGLCTRAVGSLTSGTAPPASLKHDFTDAHVELLLDVLFDPEISDDMWVEEVSQRLDARVERGELRPIQAREPGGSYRLFGITINLSQGDRNAFAMCEFRKYEDASGLPVLSRIRLARSERALFRDWIGVPLF